MADTESVLLTKTLDLLNNRPRSMTLADVADGANVPERWLMTLGKAKNGHSVTRVERVYTFLSGKELVL